MNILILGSMSFSTEMQETGKRLESLGHCVRLPEFIKDYLRLKSKEDMHKAAVKNKETYDLFKRYYELINENDAILIINKKKKGIKSYVGANSLIEMAYAHLLDKKIYLLKDMPDMDYTDEIKALKPVTLNGDLTKIPQRVGGR